MKKKHIFIVIIIAVITIVLFTVFMGQSSNTYLKPFTDISDDAVEIVNVMLPENSEIDSKTTFHNGVIANSHTAVVAEYIEYTKGDYPCRKFKNIEVVYGEAPDEYIMTYLGGFEEYSPIPEFKVGEKYLLILRRTDDIFFSHPLYHPMGQAYIPLDDLDNAVWTFGTFKLSETADVSDFVTYIAKLANDYGFSQSYFPNIIRDKDLEYVITNSDCIFKIKVDSFLNAAAYYPFYNYRCYVTEEIRGEYTPNQDGSIYIKVHPEALEEGKEYIIAVCTTDNDGKDSWFMQCSNNGIIPIENEDLVNKVYSYLEN